MSLTTTTTTTTIVETMSPFMLPGMASPELQLQIDSGSRVVRFDKECVLIPESQKQKRSMVVTRAYSLPLWKRRGQSESDIEDSAHPSERTPSPEEARVFIKVPIPTFRRRSSRSPSRRRSVSTSPMVPNRLTPCLVHRDFSTSPIVPGRVPCSPTRPSLPIYHRRKDDVTVPLRECCHACERITEECLQKGEHWQEKFSKGAKRRRSVSLEHNSPATATLSTLHIRSSRCGKVCSMESPESVGDDSRDLDLERRPCKFSITVDEVDKRRKSLDLSNNNIQCVEVEPPSLGSSYTSIFQSHMRDASHSSASSTDTTTTTDELVPDILDSKHRLRSSPIEEEEDEAELFPLPRRTPSGTPSPRVSPAPSPHGSTSSLPSSVPGVRFPDRSGSPSILSSKESVASKSSNSQESLLKASLSRKPPSGVGLGFVAASRTSGSSLSRVGVRASSSDVTPSAAKPAGTDDMGTRLGQTKLTVDGSGFVSSSSSLARSKHVLTVATSTSVASSVKPLVSSAGTPPSQHPKTPTPPSSPIAKSERPPRSTASSASSSSSPSAPSSPRSPTSEKRKLSFAAPFIRAGGALKGVGVDVLKGVSSMSPGSAF